MLLFLHKSCGAMKAMEKKIYTSLKKGQALLFLISPSQNPATEQNTPTVITCTTTVERRPRVPHATCTTQVQDKAKVK